LLRTFLTAEVFLSHSDFLDHIQLTYRVGLLWTSDQPVAEASNYTGQHYIETQETNIHALSGIRTRDPSNQAAADLCLRPSAYQSRIQLLISDDHFVQASGAIISSARNFLGLLTRFLVTLQNCSIVCSAAPLGNIGHSLGPA
jgi:hypothetical protein